LRQNPNLLDRNDRSNLGDSIVREFLFRGDTRAPQQIETSGGFSSKAPVVDATTGARGNMDPDVHQANFVGAMISWSRNYRIAKGFAGDIGWVYLARATGVDYNKFASRDDLPADAGQAEVMILQEVPLHDILAVKSMQNWKPYKNDRFQKTNMSDQDCQIALNMLIDTRTYSV
jgi:hypothetical protein